MIYFGNNKHAQAIALPMKGAIATDINLHKIVSTARSKSQILNSAIMQQLWPVGTKNNRSYHWKHLLNVCMIHHLPHHLLKDAKQKKVSAPYVNKQAILWSFPLQHIINMTYNVVSQSFFCVHSHHSLFLFNFILASTSPL